MRDYELVLLVKASDNKEPGKSIVDEVVKKAIGSGKIEKVDEWGLKSLAYPIQKQTQAAYFCLFLSLQPDDVLSLDKALAVNEQVLRHLLTKKEGGQKVNKLAVDAVEKVAKVKTKATVR